jgi:hypothetical protein
VATQVDYGRRSLAHSRVAVLSLTSCVTVAGHAQSEDELAKQLSNPISSLTSVPLQLNHDFDFDPLDGERTLLNFQPVIPVSIDENWNMISRTIVPLIAQDDVIPSGGSQSGIGDVLQSLFFSPKAMTASGWTWGVGPALSLPTATDDALGSEKWAAGPTAVALKQTAEGWTYGALVNHLVSFAGDDARDDVSRTFLQPFAAKGIGAGRTLTVNLESTYDWENSQWTIPVNFTYSKVTRMGDQRLSWAAGARYYVEAPDVGPSWGLRFVVTLLYPKG